MSIAEKLYIIYNFAVLGEETGESAPFDKVQTSEVFWKTLQRERSKADFRSLECLLHAN